MSTSRSRAAPAVGTWRLWLASFPRQLRVQLLLPWARGSPSKRQLPIGTLSPTDRADRQDPPASRNRAWLMATPRNLCAYGVTLMPFGLWRPAWCRTTALAAYGFAALLLVTSVAWAASCAPPQGYKERPRKKRDEER